MNAPVGLLLPDVQSARDERRLAIQKVGVKGLRYPLSLRRADGGVQPTVATVAMTVGLPPGVKGTHMSRFVEILERYRVPLAPMNLSDVLAATLVHLGADSGMVEMRFPYFIDKRAPVSGAASLLDCDVRLAAECRAGEDAAQTIEVTVPVTSLCPCSKQISAYGAHNQRSLITIRAELRCEVAIEEFVRMAEDEASCAIYGLLKRRDEKWVTERAYDNPKFVEDLVRDIALRLKSDGRVREWTVMSENFESIHNHSAYAELSGINA